MSRHSRPLAANDEIASITPATRARHGLVGRFEHGRLRFYPDDLVVLQRAIASLTISDLERDLREP